jgi:multidrug resistance protein, MATE family
VFEPDNQQAPDKTEQDLAKLTKKFQRLSVTNLKEEEIENLTSQMQQLSITNLDSNLEVNQILKPELSKIFSKEVLHSLKLLVFSNSMPESSKKIFIQLIEYITLFINNITEFQIINQKSIIINKKYIEEQFIKLNNLLNQEGKSEILTAISNQIPEVRIWDKETQNKLQNIFDNYYAENHETIDPVSIFKIISTACCVGLPELIISSTIFAEQIILSKINFNTLAASALISSTEGMVLGIPSAALSAIAIVASRNYGAKQFNEINATLNSGFGVGLLFAIPVTTLVLNSGWVLRLLGNPLLLTNIVQSYYFACAPSFIAHLLFMAEVEISYATENYSHINLLLPLYGGLGIGLGYYLTLGSPGLGVVGMGLSRTIAVSLTIVVFTCYLKYSDRFQPYNLINFSWSNIKEELKYLKEICVLGIPMGVEVGGELVLILINTTMVASLFSTETLAAHQVVTQYLSLLLLPISSFARAAAMLSAKSVGENNLDDTEKVGYLSVCAGLSIAAAASIVLIAIPQELSSLFLDMKSVHAANVVNITKPFFFITAIGLVFDSLRLISAANLQGGFSDSIFPMGISLASLIMAVPAGYILAVPFGFGATGIYWTRTASLCVAGISIFCRWRGKIEDKKLETTIHQQADLPQNRTVLFGYQSSNTTSVNQDENLSTEKTAFEEKSTFKKRHCCNRLCW